jgi:hypothetical protein
MGLLLAGWGGGYTNNDSSSSAPNNNDGGSNTNNNPASLAGKTLSFTVTARQGLSEPVGSTYTIVFDTSTYTFNPSPQNVERTTPFTDAYTYDPGTATAILSGTETVTATFDFTTPASGAYHFQETDGEMQDGTFSQL